MLLIDVEGLRQSEVTRLVELSHYYPEDWVSYLYGPVGLGNESAATSAYVEPRRAK